MTEAEKLSYLLAKQLASAHAISTSYGDIELDDQTHAALDNALRPILKHRLNELIADDEFELTG